MVCYGSNFQHGKNGRKKINEKYTTHFNDYAAMRSRL